MTDHLHALAMRTKAAETATEYMDWADNWGEYKNQKACDICSAEIATAILALPLESDHAALLAEAVKLPEIVALIEAMRGTLPALAESGSYPNMPHFNAVKALSALETP